MVSYDGGVAAAVVANHSVGVCKQAANYLPCTAFQSDGKSGASSFPWRTLMGYTASTCLFCKGLWADVAFIGLRLMWNVNGLD